MGCHAHNRMGVSIVDPTDRQLRELLASLEAVDDEHPDVSLTHEAGWSLSVFGSGLVVLENVETGEGPWHMRSIAKQDAFEMWKLLAAGQVDQLGRREWLSGYGADA
jgi:hypothetical protein